MSPDTAPSLQIDGARATIRLRRPLEHNRTDPSDLAVLLDHLGQACSDTAVRVLVVTWSNQKTFISGYTVAATREHLDDCLENVLDTLESLPLPVVCALNGSVYGGAIDLALCCDSRIGVKGSRMFMPAAKFGLHYYPGGIRRYITRLGLSSAKRLFLTTQAIDAEEMLRIDFLTGLVDADQFEPAVAHYVDAIVECEPGGVALMKLHLNQTADGDIDITAQRAAYEQSLRSDELARRLQALAKV
jgi:enoyl-CoA hydratase/carnithine racemase